MANTKWTEKVRECVMKAYNEILEQQQKQKQKQQQQQMN